MILSICCKCGKWLGFKLFTRVNSISHGYCERCCNNEIDELDSRRKIEREYRKEVIKRQKDIDNLLMGGGCNK